MQRRADQPRYSCSRPPIFDRLRAAARRALYCQHRALVRQGRAVESRRVSTARINRSTLTGRSAFASTDATG
jgi:hypothetical protein